MKQLSEQNIFKQNRNYSGPTSQSVTEDRKSRLHSSRGNYSPVIEIDEDSHSKFVSESNQRTSRHGGGSGAGGGVGGGANADEGEDPEWRRDTYCAPRNSLLSLTADFIVKTSAKMQEINKKDRQDKSFEPLDTKCYMKLVDVAHSLLKMAPYDQECIKSRGLQKYMNRIFPITDWSLESMKPALTTIIRRIDKLFAKIHKSVKVYHAVDWTAAAGLLQGLYATLWKHPYIASLPNLKSLIGTCQCIVVGEESLTSLSDHHGPSSRRPELPPKSFCSIVFQLVALQVNIDLI